MKGIYENFTGMIDRAAEILQLDDKIGTLEVGKLADIAAWKRDLLPDPKALLDCAFVMKEGVIYQTECCEDIED